MKGYPNIKTSAPTNEVLSERHAERSEASLEDQEMINSTKNRTSRDPSCLPMTDFLAAVTLIPIAGEGSHEDPQMIKLNINRTSGDSSYLRMTAA